MLNNKNNLDRITSIDALRGIVLLGIFLVHIGGYFGFFTIICEAPGYIERIIALLLSKRCAPIFSMLFGVSFYLILRKGNYSGLKFFWRCFLLCLIGLFNKIFYTYDALLLYGLCGMILLLFRNMSTKGLFISFLVLYVSSVVLPNFNLGDMLFEDKIFDRYQLTATLSEIMGYPLWKSILEYFYLTLQSGVFGTMAYFVLGYFFAKRGIIENLNRYVTKRNMLLFMLIVIVFYAAYILFEYQLDIKIHVLKRVGNLFSALLYASFFLYLYYKMPSLFSVLESYGKLGLTNYTTQSIYGVIAMTVWYIPYNFTFGMILLCSLAFYALQCLFSYCWLKYFKYGPLEYLWRSLTNMKFQSPLI